MRYILFLFVVPVVLHASCGPIDDDDSAVEDDDDVTPDPACTDGWEPLAILDGFDSDIRDYSVDPGSGTLAVITPQYLTVFDVSEPRIPVLLETFYVEDIIDSTATWIAISAAEDGHVVLGRWQNETGGWAHVQLIDATEGSAALGFETTLFAGEPNEHGTVGEASDITARGAQSGVVTWHPGEKGESTAYFLEHRDSGLVVAASRPSLWWGLDNMAHAGSALIHPGTPNVSVIPSDPASEIVRFEVSGGAEIPLETGAGWLIPTIGGCVGPNELYRLNTDLSAVEQIGVTEMSCAFENNDGAHQLTVYEDELFVANGLAGLLRGAWTPDDWIAVEGPSTLTPQLWQEYVGADGSGSIRVERDEDILFVSGQWSTTFGEWDMPSVGVVRICPL